MRAVIEQMMKVGATVNLDIIIETSGTLVTILSPKLSSVENDVYGISGHDDLAVPSSDPLVTSVVEKVLIKDSGDMFPSDGGGFGDIQTCYLYIKSDSKIKPGDKIREVRDTGVPRDFKVERPEDQGESTAVVRRFRLSVIA